MPECNAQRLEELTASVDRSISAVITALYDLRYHSSPSELRTVLRAENAVLAAMGYSREAYDEGYPDWIYDSQC